MNRLAALGAVAACVSLTGCVEAPPGIPLGAVSSRSAPYAVSVLAPRDAPRAQGVAGSLDSHVVQDTSLTLAGWAPEPAGALVVVAAVPLTLVSQRRQRRPDAARALGPGHSDEIGFSLQFASSARGPLDVCVLFEPPGGGSILLAGSSPTLCPPR